MMKAEMASETSRSRAHTAITGRGCAPDSLAAGAGGCVLPTSGIVSIFYRKSKGKIGNCVICNLQFHEVEHGETQAGRMFKVRIANYKSPTTNGTMTDYSIFPKINATLNGC